MRSDPWRHSIPRSATARGVTRSDTRPASSSTWRSSVSSPAWPSWSPPPSCADSGGNLVHGYRLLLTASEVLEADVVIGQLLTDDHRPAGSGLARRLELLSELAAAAIDPHRHAGVAQARGDSKPIGMVMAEPDDGDHRRHGGQRHLLLLHGEDRPVEPDPETDARGGAPAEQLDQAVVTAAAAQGLLLPLASGDHELE